MSIKLQVDMFTLPNGKNIILLAKGRLVYIGFVMAHPDYVMSSSFSNQALTQFDLWCHRANYTVGVHMLFRRMDEEGDRFHLQALAIKLTLLCGH